MEKAVGSEGESGPSGKRVAVSADVAAEAKCEPQSQEATRRAEEDESPAGKAVAKMPSRAARRSSPLADWNGPT